nr:MAG: tetratricopeptide repeat protein [Leptolyngbya sp. IPPAS B-1204]
MFNLLHSFLPRAFHLAAKNPSLAFSNKNNLGQKRGLFYRLARLDGFDPAAAIGVIPESVEPISEPCSDHYPLTESELNSQTLACLQDGHLRLQAGDLAGAVAAYRQAIYLNPQHGEAYQYLAEALSQQGELQEAAFCYRQAIALSSESASESNGENTSKRIRKTNASINAKTTYRLQKHSLEDGSAETFAVNAETTEMPWFEQASFYLQQAMVHCNAGHWSDAVAASQLALEQLEPEAFNAYLTLGRALQGQGQLTSAEQAYHKAIVLQPNSAEAHARLGSLYAAQEHLTKAVKQYQTAIQLDATFAGAYWKLAEVWQQLNQEEEAISCWYQALQLQPSWASATEYCSLANRLLNLGQLAAAKDYYDRALQNQPSLAEAAFGLGQVLSQQGHTKIALSYYRQALHQTQNYQLCLQLGDAFSDLEQWQDALLCYQHVVQTVPDHVEAMAGLQQCCIQLEQWQDASEYSQRLVSLQPSAQNWHQLGDVFSRLHRWFDAVDAYQQAIVLDPNFAWSHNNLGDVLLQLDQWQQAANAYTTAITLNPNFAWSHFNLGEAWSHLEAWDAAIESYRTALKLQPDLPHAPARLAHALQQRATDDRASALRFYRQAIQQQPYEPENYHKALELQPDAVELYLGLTEALLIHNRLDEALVCCQIARQLQPDDAEIIARLKQILQQQEQVRQPRMSNDGDYERWLEQHNPTAADLQRMAEVAVTFTYQPLISILMPVYNTPEPFLRAALQSVLDQVYQHWELCIADDASSEPHIRAILNAYVAQDSRIKVAFREQNGHISAASNTALAQAEGEYIALLDHDDVLAPEALYEMVALLNRHLEADMIYSDEDKLDPQGHRTHPFFKPDWCPDSFLSRMYTCHLGLYRRQLVERVGGFQVGYEGSQDYDLVLRLSEQTNRIFHIPKVLYHWRMHPTSTASDQTTKSYAEIAAKRAILNACSRRGEPARAVITQPEFPGVYIVRYQITDYKPVSIIIPTRNLGAILDRCLDSIFQKTTYPNYEIVLIDNGSDEIETLRVISKWEQSEPERFNSHTLDIPFNYSTINNYAVTQAKGDYLLFLNNDVEVITPDWIEAMVEQAQRPSIGAVGALLLYPDATVQHAGVVLGIGGIAGHSHKYFSSNNHGYFSQLVSVNNYSAVTAACLMCRRELFNQTTGFDPSLAVAFNDVDFCLKLGQLGYRNLYLPHVVLYHHESKSRGTEDTLEKQRRFRQELETMRQRWGDLLLQDPCYSPHLTLEREDYSLRLV